MLKFRRGLNAQCYLEHLAPIFDALERREHAFNPDV